MTEHSAGAAGEHGSHPASALRQALVADGIDALVDAMELAQPSAPVDRLTTETELNELSKGNDSVLPGGQRRDSAMDRVRLRFVSHGETKCRRGPNSPPLVAPFRANPRTA